MERTLNRQELEDQLSGKAQSIGRRLDALQEEVGGLSVRNFVRRRPLPSAVLVVAAGFLTAILLAGSKRASKRKSPTNVLHKELVERYVETIADDAHRLVARGKNVSDAVAKALRGRVPILVYAPDKERAPAGFVRDFASIALQAASGFAIKSVVDFATSRIDLHSSGEGGATAGPVGTQSTGTEQGAVSDPLAS